MPSASTGWRGDAPATSLPPALGLDQLAERVPVGNLVARGLRGASELIAHDFHGLGAGLAPRGGVGGVLVDRGEEDVPVFQDGPALVVEVVRRARGRAGIDEALRLAQLAVRLGERLPERRIVRGGQRPVLGDPEILRLRVDGEGREELEEDAISRPQALRLERDVGAGDRVLVARRAPERLTGDDPRIGSELWMELGDAFG